MVDLLSEIEKQVKALSEFIQDHQGQDVTVLDLRPFQIWTDFFIITTVSSNTHMDGLERHIKEFCRERKIDVSGSPRKKADDEWRLLDLGIPGLGSVIVHLMNKRVRDFYELERLWSKKHS
ncbi:MAG: ribosome silencing factor [Treponema sp.]|jgi:ribosome-associated protein|nr:ribosome silencing factor [Treponema sp.]